MDDTVDWNHTWHLCKQPKQIYTKWRLNGRFCICLCPTRTVHNCQHPTVTHLANLINSMLLPINGRCSHQRLDQWINLKAEHVCLQLSQFTGRAQFLDWEKFNKIEDVTHATMVEILAKVNVWSCHEWYWNLKYCTLVVFQCTEHLRMIPRFIFLANKNNRALICYLCPNNYHL